MKNLLTLFLRICLIMLLISGTLVTISATNPEDEINPQPAQIVLKGGYAARLVGFTEDGRPLFLLTLR